MAEIKAKQLCRGVRNLEFQAQKKAALDLIHGLNADPDSNSSAWEEAEKAFLRIQEWDPCGFDLTSLAAAVPEDGEIHMVKCPKCKSDRKFMRTPAPAAEEEKE